MTFYEAAVEVLRRTNRPLHFKKITELAIRDALLSHVGKTPETTMGERLELEVRREDESIVIKTRPGVYALKDEVLDRLNQEAEEREARRVARSVNGSAQEPESVEVDAEPDTQDSIEIDEADVDEADDSDDSDDSGDAGEENDENEENTSEESEEGEEENGADDSEDDDSDSEEGSEESSDDSPREGGGRRRRRRRRRGGRSSEPRADDDAPATEQQGVIVASAEVQPDVQGRFDSVGEAAYAVLKASGRTPLNVETISQTIFQKKLVRFHTHDPAATVQSAMVTDNQVRQRLGKRPLFSGYGPNSWGLTEWGLSEAGVQKERQLHKLVQDLRDDACTQLGKALQDVKPQAIEMMVITLLERLDYGNLKVSKRSSDGDVYFTADWRRGFSEIRVSVQVVVNGSTEVSAKDVNALRDSLGHNAAEEGILIHLGRVNKDAVKEGKKGESKVTVIDRDSLLHLLVQEGIGVKSYSVPVSMVDTAFIEALRE